ncbi:unnamed protein product [Pylaiella littoralis]
MSGSGGRRGEPVRVYEGSAQQMFTCHMCKRKKNKGEYRIAHSSEQNPHGWDHFCFECSRSEQALERRGYWGSHGTLDSAPVVRAPTETDGPGAGAQPTSPVVQPSAVSVGGCSTTGDGPIYSRGVGCCNNSSSNNSSSSSSAAAPRVSSAYESLECSTEGEHDEVGRVEDDEGEPEEGEAKADDPHRWNNCGLQDALVRLGRSVTLHLPTAAVDGSLRPPGTRGGDAAVLPPPRVVAAQFRERFPEAPFCRPVESVEVRALAAMRPSSATAAMKKRAKKGGEVMDMEMLDDLLREAAMAVFATIHVVVIVYLLEVVFFEDLVKLKCFQVETASGRGVMMICPGCKTNKYVVTPGHSGGGYPSLNSDRVRVAHDVCGVVMPIFGRYSCKNPKCSLVIDSAKKAARKAKKDVDATVWDEKTVLAFCPKNGVSFNTMDERYMKLLPKEVVSQLPVRFFKQGGVSEGLLDRLRATGGDMQPVHRILTAGNQGQELRDIHRYLRFVTGRQAIERQQQQAIEMKQRSVDTQLQAIECKRQAVERKQQQAIEREQQQAIEGEQQAIEREYQAVEREQQAIEKERQKAIKKKDEPYPRWPTWKFNRSTLTSTPSIATLNTFYKAGHEEEKGHMLRELLSQCFGEFLNMDGTFRVAGRVMDAAECIFFVLGEDAKVHGYAAIMSESKEQLLPFLARYAERRRRHGTLAALRWLYDDLCCKGGPE